MKKAEIPGKILIVDDDLEDHEIIKIVGRSLGVLHAIEFFSTGHELLTYLARCQRDPFIIICDINMPTLNGLDLREAICNDFFLRDKSIPFIFFSTMATRAQVQQAYDLSVQGFFIKGTTLRETERKLRIVIEYWMESIHPQSNLNRESDRRV